MKLNKRITELEERMNPKPKPTLKVFTQHIDGRVTGQGLEFENKADYDKYAEQQGFHEGEQIKSVLFVVLVNAQKEPPAEL